MWPQHQVPVVGHETIGEDVDRNSLPRLGEDFEEGGVVTIFVQDGAAGIAAVDDMVNQARNDRAKGAGLRSILINDEVDGEELRGDPF